MSTITEDTHEISLYLLSLFTLVKKTKVQEEEHQLERSHGRHVSLARVFLATHDDDDDAYSSIRTYNVPREARARERERERQRIMFTN